MIHFRVVLSDLSIGIYTEYIRPNWRCGCHYAGLEFMAPSADIGQRRIPIAVAIRTQIVVNQVS